MLTLRRMVPGHGALLIVAGQRHRERAGERVRPAVVGRQDALRRRLRPVVAAHLVHDPRAVVDVGERIGAGVLGLLEGVGDGAVEVVAEPPVQPDVEAPDVAEVQVGQDPEVVVAALRRVEQADQTGRRVAHDVLVVRGDVQHHVVVERVPDAELEGDGLAEVEVGAEDLVGVGVAQVDVDPAQQQAEVRRLHLVRVAEPEVGPVGHRERHLHVRAQVAVALVLDEQRRRVGRIEPGHGGDPGEGVGVARGVGGERPAGAGVVPVVAQAAHHDHVTQVEPVLDEARSTGSAPRCRRRRRTCRSGGSCSCRCCTG